MVACDVEPAMSDISRRVRFERLARDMYHPLLRYARRRVPADDADDVVSDVLLTVWRRLDDVPDEALPWAYGVARLVIANRRRSRSRHLRLLERLESERGPGWQSEPELGDLDPDLEVAWLRLADAEREILRLWAWEQLEPREIAEVLQLTPNAATLRLRRARSKLASALERQNPGSSGHEVIDKAEESA